MPSKPKKVVIINRSFWPVYPIIGEALLQLAERAVDQGHPVFVIMQGSEGINARLMEAGRGKGVFIHSAKALTTSASNLFFRICDAVFFMIWVLGSLIWIRPQKVYVSTDPPLLVPFVVMLFCRFSGAEYVYHLQDIHPEATHMAFPLNKWVFKAMMKVDSITLRRSKCLITITKGMRAEILARSDTKSPIHVLDNPAVSFDGINTNKAKIAGFSFCGNAGRFQRIPLLLKAIEVYFNKGGTLQFIFAGGGVYMNCLKEFHKRHKFFHYSGVVCSTEAAQINADYSWALLPIEDDVTRYSFPSKSSSYVLSGACILAVCGKQTAVAKWVSKNRLGVVVKPTINALVEKFFEIEKGSFGTFSEGKARDLLKEKLKLEVFVDNLDRIVLG